MTTHSRFDHFEDGFGNFSHMGCRLDAKLNNVLPLHENRSNGILQVGQDRQVVISFGFEVGRKFQIAPQKMTEP